MPEIVAAAVAFSQTAGAAIAATGITAYQVATVAFLVGNAASVSRQRRKAIKAANAQIEDRRVMASGSAEPIKFAFGRTRIGLSRLAPGWTWGTHNRNWTIPFAIVGHQIQSVDEVWMGEESVGTLDGDGYVSNPSRYYKSAPGARVITITGGAPTETYTFSGGVADMRVDSIAHDGDPTDASALVLVEGVDYTMSRVSNNLRITWVTDGWDDLPMVVTYTREDGAPYARFRPFLGVPAGARDTELEGTSGGEWTSTDIGCNMARIHATLIFDQDLFPSGIPPISAVIKGALLYDPRLDSTNGGTGSHRFATPSTWEWSDNSALCWAWYMTWSGGMGCTVDEIDWPSVITAANICDEDVPTDGGSGVQARYTCNGVLSTADEVRSNVDKILSSMGGTRYLSGGKWYVRAGAYVSPTLDLDDDDFAPGDIVVRPRPKRRDLFNSVRGLYVDGHAAGALDGTDPGGFWAPTDFPQYSSATYVAEDGGDELWEDIELPLTDDWRRAQRLAKLILFRSRQALTISCNWKAKAYKLQPGDTFRITSSINGWTNKVFRVEDRQYNPHGDIALIAQEEASAVYAWDYSEVNSPDPAPNTELPDPRIVAPLAGFSVSAGSSYVLPDGSIVPYSDATWTAVADSAVLSGGRIEVWWKRAIDTVYRKLEARPDDTTVRFEPVSGGDTINAFAVVVNGSQVRSTPVFATVQIDSSLPAGVYVPPLSANLLRSVTFEHDVVAGWAPFTTGGTVTPTFQRHVSSALYVNGSPSSAYIDLPDTSTGVGKVAGVYTESLIPIDASKQYIAYTGLIPYGGDGIIVVQWFDGSQTYITGGDMTSSAIANTSVVPGAAWGDPRNYTDNVAEVRGSPPSAAAFARVLIAIAGTWAAVPVKYMPIHKPFFGEFPTGAFGRPPWDAGSASAVATENMALGAATGHVRSQRVPSARLTFGEVLYYGNPSTSIAGRAVADLEYTPPVSCVAEIVVNGTVKFTTPSDTGLGVKLSLLRSDTIAPPDQLIYSRQVAICPSRSYTFEQAFSIETDLDVTAGVPITITAVLNVTIDTLGAAGTITADVYDVEMKLVTLKR